MYVDPGDLNKRIQIVSLSDGETYDDEGHKVKDEIIVRTCWAKVSNTSGTELITADAELSDEKKRFLIRREQLRKAFLKRRSLMRKVWC